jgi:ferrous iron transport protein A
MHKEYIIENVISDDTKIINFLFTLGCFKGQSITVISSLSDTFVIVIKDARYSIDADLANTITLC